MYIYVHVHIYIKLVFILAYNFSNHYVTSDICYSLGEFIFIVSKGNLFPGLHALKYKREATFYMSFLTHVE